MRAATTVAVMAVAMASRAAGAKVGAGAKAANAENKATIIR